MTALSIKNLTKHLGKKLVLDNLSFEVNRGEVFGLIGPNGAGKTTTLRTIATLLQIESGEVNVLGHALPQQAPAVRRILSYLPEDAGAYKHLKGREYLEFVAAFFVHHEKPADTVKRGMAIADLGERINDRVDTYSKGMMRRLLIGRALMTTPELAILDEPSSGLDVINAREVRRTIQKAAKEGMTVLLSSHNMLEVELMCDRVALINDGRIVASGTPQELKTKYNAANIEEVFTEVVGCC
jgi:ABC-2 type transport system ATP-binding protein